MLGMIILAILIVLLLATVPYYPYSRGWGYGPSGFVAAVMLIWLALIYIGMVTWGWSDAAIAPT